LLNGGIISPYRLLMMCWGQLHLTTLNDLSSLKIKGIRLIGHLLSLPVADDVSEPMPFARLE